jgi:hypothetical protein
VPVAETPPQMASRLRKAEKVFILKESIKRYIARDSNNSNEV